MRIGEYTNCKHGPNGTRAVECIPCAIEYHTARQVENAERADYHLRMIRQLEDELISRNMAKADAALTEQDSQ